MELSYCLMDSLGVIQKAFSEIGELDSVRLDDYYSVLVLLRLFNCAVRDRNI